MQGKASADPDADKGQKAGWFGGLLGRKFKRGHMGQESQMYYNKELGRWVEKGKEAEAAQESVTAPPPTIGGYSDFTHSRSGGISKRYVIGPGIVQAPVSAPTSTSTDAPLPSFGPPSAFGKLTYPPGQPPKIFVPSQPDDALQDPQPYGQVSLFSTGGGSANDSTQESTDDSAASADSSSSSSTSTPPVAPHAIPTTSSHEPSDHLDDFDKAMHPGTLTKLDGPLPWELPEPLRNADNFISLCKNWQRDHPDTIYKPELLEEYLPSHVRSVNGTATATAPPSQERPEAGVRDTTLTPTYHHQARHAHSGVEVPLTPTRASVSAAVPVGSHAPALVHQAVLHSVYSSVPAVPAMDTAIDTHEEYVAPHAQLPDTMQQGPSGSSWPGDAGEAMHAPAPAGMPEVAWGYAAQDKAAPANQATCEQSTQPAHEVLPKGSETAWAADVAVPQAQTELTQQGQVGTLEQQYEYGNGSSEHHLSAQHSYTAEVQQYSASAAQVDCSDQPHVDQWWLTYEGYCRWYEGVTDRYNDVAARVQADPEYMQTPEYSQWWAEHELALQQDAWYKATYPVPGADSIYPDQAAEQVQPDDVGADLTSSLPQSHEASVYDHQQHEEPPTAELQELSPDNSYKQPPLDGQLAIGMPEVAGDTGELQPAAGLPEAAVQDAFWQQQGEQPELVPGVPEVEDSHTQQTLEQSQLVLGVPQVEDSYTQQTLEHSQLVLGVPEVEDSYTQQALAQSQLVLGVPEVEDSYTQQTLVVGMPEAAVVSALKHQEPVEEPLLQAVATLQQLMTAIQQGQPLPEAVLNGARSLVALCKNPLLVKACQPVDILSQTSLTATAPVAVTSLPADNSHAVGTTTASRQHEQQPEDGSQSRVAELESRVEELELHVVDLESSLKEEQDNVAELMVVLGHEETKTAALVDAMYIAGLDPDEVLSEVERQRAMMEAMDMMGDVTAGTSAVETGADEAGDEEQLV